MGVLNDSDRAFIEQFESCRLQKTCWNHEAHVRMAWIEFSRAESFDEALLRIREGIRRFNASVSSIGYHETVTVAFSRIIYFRILHADPTQTWLEFLSENQDFFLREPPILHFHYSHALLANERSKLHFVPPDLRPLPVCGFIRRAKESDAADIAQIYFPYVEHSPTSFEYVPPLAAAMSERMHEINTHATWLVYEVAGRIAGYAYASKHRARDAYQWTVEVSAYIDENFKKMGLGRLLYSRLFKELDVMGFHLALAGITLPNEASIGFHEAMGFTPVGTYREIGFKFGKWHDVGWWQRLLKPSGTMPSPLKENCG